MFFRTPLIGQRIASGFAIALLAMLAVGVFSLRSLEQMRLEASSVTHTLEVLSESRLLNDSFTRIESSSRGFVLTGDAGLRAEVDREAETAAASVQRLRFLTVDNAAQQARLTQLGQMLDRRLANSREEMARRAVGPSSDRAVGALVAVGQALSRDFRDLVTALADEETRLLGLRQDASLRATAATRAVVIDGSLGAFALILVGGFFLTRSVTSPLARLRVSADRLGQGDYAHRVELVADDEIGRLGMVFNRMAEQVERRQAVLADQDWLKTGLAEFAVAFQNQRDPAVIGRIVLEGLARLTGARHGVLYRLAAGGGDLELCASYAAENPPARLAPGMGLLGQSAAQKRRLLLDEVPPDYLRISSALGAGRPAALLVHPVEFEGTIKAALELASFQSFTPLQLELVERLAPMLGAAFQNLESIARTEELLRQAQALTVQLEEQQVELTQTNEELEQTNEEMEQTNEELEEKSMLLADQKRELESSNRLIEQARNDLQEQARQLQASSTYKSNFLATMSHELRTPLNSLLILARILAENKGANLTAKQVEFARTIESSGADLLELINQILDLTKIEAGKMELHLDETAIGDLKQALEQQFHPLAESKRLEFGVELGQDLPPRIRTDVGRLHQILKNLLANAFKFTENGSVRVSVALARGGWKRSTPSLEGGTPVVAIAVRDTGIGIPREKQDLIFESFQQADAGVARRFGGTGLGLSISRELAGLLGGTLQLESDPGRGSTFTLFIPAQLEAPVPPALPATAAEAPPAVEPADDPGPDEGDITDDRANLRPDDRVLLIIEDDVSFAGILGDLAREKGFKTLMARSAGRGLALARQHAPSAVTLDLSLLDGDGWLVLDRLKHDERTRHIPVHLISVSPGRARGLLQGAVSYLQKPVTREAISEILQRTIDLSQRMRNLLVVEDDSVQRRTICELIGNGDVHTTAVGSAAEALEAVGNGTFDCVVMDLMLPDCPGADLIREINRRLGMRSPPIIVYTGKDLTPAEETELRSLSESIIVKDARSPERLLDETALFLHRVQARLPAAKRRMLARVRAQDAVLTGRRVLIVDDDVRNIFALTAALESYGMQVQFAESGQAAIDRLQTDSAFDAVLMDVMMPGMDGNEATRRLRADRRYAKLPIIAVTAKAMKGDRERSIEAGASDYITKPVETEKLLSLLRVWLYR